MKKKREEAGNAFFPFFRGLDDEVAQPMKTRRDGTSLNFCPHSYIFVKNILYFAFLKACCH